MELSASFATLGNKSNQALMDASKTDFFEMVKSCARLLTIKFNDVLKPFGITSEQYLIMRELHRHYYKSLTQMSAYFDIDRTTLSRNIKLLLSKDLLIKYNHPNSLGEVDKKSKAYGLSTIGHQLFMDAYIVYEYERLEFNKRFSEGEAIDLEIYFNRLTDKQ